MWRDKAKIISGEDRTRTSAGNAGETGPWPESGAESGALSGESTPTDANLQAVVDAWPSLPDPVKAGILAMVTAAAKAE